MERSSHLGSWNYYLPNMQSQSQLGTTIATYYYYYLYYCHLLLLLLPAHKMIFRSRGFVESDVGTFFKWLQEKSF